MPTMLERWKQIRDLSDAAISELSAQPPVEPPTQPQLPVGALVLTPEQGRKAIEAAWASANPGAAIVLRGGLWDLGTAEGIFLSGRNGAEGKPIKIMAYPGELPQLNGKRLTGNYYGKASAGGYGLVLMDVRYIEVDGLLVEQCPFGGVALVGSSITSGGVNNSVLRNLVSRRNGFGGAEGKGVIMFCNSNNNLLERVDSYENADAAGGNADGFQMSSIGNDNVMRACRAWDNSDDGFDFFNIHNGTRAGPVLLEDCAAWHNGFANGLRKGDGNGFKLGGIRAGTSGTSGGHIVRRSAAWNNGANGFDNNIGTNIIVEQSTAYNNSQFNVTEFREFEFSTGLGHVLSRNVAMPNRVNAGKAAQQNNSWQLGSIKSSDFLSLDQNSPDFLRLRPGSIFYGLGVP